MYKKKILFLCSNMNIGGFQKSLINLLNYFDYEKYEVDLFLIEKNGIFAKYINKKVNILYANDFDRAYCKDYKHSINQLKKEKKYFLMLKRTINACISCIDKGYGAVMMGHQIKQIDKHYDCCIDYCGQYLNYYMIDKISAKKKISYFHNDYAKWDYYKRTDKKYYKKDDYIVTVSKECVESLKQYFPKQSKKIKCIENIITIDTIKPFLEKSIRSKEIKKEKFLFVSVGRLVPDKGIDLAIVACSRLKDVLGFDFQWLWIGPGDLNYYNELVKKYHVEDVFFLLGGKENPYTYIHYADVVVHPARFEGKAVAVEEALVMNKLIIATNYSTVRNQIINQKTGIICELDVEAIVRAIQKIVTDLNLQKEILRNQKELCKGNAYEVEKLYKLIEV